MPDVFAFDEAARCLAELGHPHRLQVFNLLVKAGDEGMPVGQIQRAVGVPKSTLAHHIAQLLATGLITQTREGRVQRCRVSPDRTRKLMSFLGDCCEGLPDVDAALACDR